MASTPFDEYRDTPLWMALEDALRELTTTDELSVNTAPDYVVGFLCRELTAKKLVLPRSVGDPA